MKVRATVLVLFAVLAVAAPARASTFTVSGTADSLTGTCDGTTCATLRAALAAASKATGPDSISLPRTTRDVPYRVTAGQLSVDSEVTITGQSAAVTGIQGDGKSSRIFDVATTAKVTFSHVTISSGAATSTDDGIGGDIRLDQGGNLTLDHVRVTGGTALRGGGIGMGPASTLTITQSLIDHNTATFATGTVSGDAGALLSVGNAKLAGNVLHVSDSTIAQNSASQGAGIELTSNPANQTTLDRVTIAFNSGGSNTLGNGVSANDTESIKAGSSIIAGNTGDGVPTNCDHKLTSTGGNIDTATSCGFASPGDKPSTDPQLSTVLGIGGGETPVLSIPATSPAVDFAPACTGADQRDLSRPQGKSCDSGAYEVDEPPRTSITGGPSGLVSSTNATFTFASTDPGSTFKCSLDGAAEADCSPPQTYNGLAQGAHTFSARAIDPAGNADPTPASTSWTVDTVAPDTTLTTTPPTRVNGSITFAFSSNDASATFQCRLDTPAGAGSYGTCSSPRTYSSLSAGNYRFHVVATDPAGNTDPTEVTWDFQVDLTPPETALVPITSPTKNATPSFSFTSSESGSTFQCKLDSGSFSTCTSPHAIAALSDGSHTFSVQATDAAGNVDPTPASQTFVVDTVAPDTTITDQPPPLQSGRSVSLKFMSADTSAGFQCKLDGPGTATGSFQSCPSPAAYTGLADGSYTFSVAAVDAAGNTDQSPARATFAIDGTAPAAPTITTPAGNVLQASGTVQLAGSAETGATVRVFDGNSTTPAGATTASGTGAWTLTLNNVADGAHGYTAKAVDAAGNVSPASSQRTVTVDTTPPAKPAITAPADNAWFKTAAPTLSGTAERNATITLREGTTVLATTAADGNGAWSIQLSGVADGSHTYAAKATDAAGNVSPASDPKPIRVDTNAPDAPVITSPPDGTQQHDTTVALSGTAEAGSTVEVREGGTSRGTTTAAGDGHWTRAIAGVPDGLHAYTATATDAAGNVSADSVARHVSVDTGPPDPPAFAAAPAIQASSTVSLGGTTEPGATVEVFEGATSLGTVTADSGDWAKTLSGVPDGTHTYTARATDIAGNPSALSSPHTVTVDTTPPPADVTGGPDGVTTDAAPAFSFNSADGSARFLCRLDGPGGPGTEQACTSPHNFGTLAPGGYTLFVTAVDPAGNRTTTSRSFTVAAVPQATPTPTPTVTPSQGPPPEPVFQQTVVVQPAGGTVLVRLKGSKTFVPLDATQGIPLGSEVDARHGKVQLTSAPSGGGAPQTALFYGGIFVVTQPGGITQLALSEKLATCSAAKGRAAAAAAKKKQPKTRNLWGDGHGSFRTKGQYSAATVRGTKWNVQDSCAGTLTRVARGVVAVNDFVRHRTKVLRAGQRYLAKPKGR